MVVSIRRCLTALTFASAALATTAPWFENTLVGRDLDSRQNSECNPNGYTSANGLNFTTYCGQNNPFNDAEPPFKTPSMAECMERCSRYAGNGEGCFGVVWIPSRTECWIRNSTTGTQNLKKVDNAHSALLVDGQMGTFDTKCPKADASTNELPGTSGMGYTMNCNKAISGYDTCFSGMNKPCFEAPYSGYFHTETMEECIQICVDQHPLCKAVTWSPELKIGYANCIPKTGYPEGTLPSPGSKQGILHSATISRIDTVNRDCPTSKTYTTQKSTFDIHCNQASSGTNMTMLHTQNVTACMDACASSEQKCVGVVFDSSLAGGFKNCYLQNTTNTVADLSSYMYASLSSNSGSGGSNNGNNGNSGSGSNGYKKKKSQSKAWIAGVVIGALAAIALIAFAIWWFRRRRAAKAANAAIEKDGHEFGAYGPAPAYSPGATQGSYSDAPLVGRELNAAHPMEMSGDSHVAGELPATSSEKYAKERRGPVSELP